VLTVDSELVGNVCKKIRRNWSSYSEGTIGKHRQTRKKYSDLESLGSLFKEGSG
jgi:hypothetical protein